MMMDNNQMETILVTDPSNNQVCLANSKRWKRVLTGESLFMTALSISITAKQKYLCFSLSWKNSSDRFN
jgi:hypothetical protein